MNKYIKTITNGIITENPTFVLLLGMCPTLATTTSAINGLSMGLATTFVLICSNVMISLLKRLIPDAVRIPALSSSSQASSPYCRWSSRHTYQHSTRVWVSSSR